MGTLSSVTYSKKSTLEDAPKRADCLTATHYFFKTALHSLVPVYLIGDMPRMLVKAHSWKLLKVDESDLRDGDLLFVKDVRFRRFVMHVGWVAKGRICHVSPKGLEKQTLVEFMTLHEQPYGSNKLLRYVDRRNIMVRSKLKGVLLRDDN